VGRDCVGRGGACTRLDIPRLCGFAALRVTKLRGRGARGHGEHVGVAQDPLVLLQGVREVAALVNPAEPEEVTQREFDAKRVRSGAHAHLPAARRITERLGMSWPRVLAIAHRPEAEQARLLGIAERMSRSAPWLSEKHLAAMLQIVAARLGADSVSMAEYEAERAKIGAPDHVRAMLGSELLVPSAAQIELAAGSWDEAMRFAGLRSPERAPGPTRKAPNSPSLPDLMERFYEVHGVQPTAAALHEFARASGIPYPGAKSGNMFRKAKEEWIARRRDAGEPAPKRPAHGRGRAAPRPDYGTKTGAVLSGERRIDRWDRESCIAAVAEYIAQLPRGKRARSTSRGYRSWEMAQEHAPVMTTVQYHCGSWEAARRAALKQLRDKDALGARAGSDKV